jgi:hypothetical protein
MKIFYKFLAIMLIFTGLLFISNFSYAQCSMCQATVESNMDNGGTTASGLNSGIMYLLAAPYLAIAGIAWLWYKKYRKKNVAIDMKEHKINLN